MYLNVVSKLSSFCVRPQPPSLQRLLFRTRKPSHFATPLVVYVASYTHLNVHLPSSESIQLLVSLHDDPTLKRVGITLDIGRVKNVNKNPVAEKAIAELEEEILRQTHNGGPISTLTLAVATSRLNSRLRSNGLSARKLWTQRDQLTSEQLPISDREIILKQHVQRMKNHPYSQKSKNRTQTRVPPPTVNAGEFVHLMPNRDKTQSRSRYLVVSVKTRGVLSKSFQAISCVLLPIRLKSRSVS